MSLTVAYQLKQFVTLKIQVNTTFDNLDQFLSQTGAVITNVKKKKKKKRQQP